MDFATVLKSIVDTLGATVLLPLFIFIFALILGSKVGRAFRAAVTIGVAFIGINLVIGLMWGALSGVSQALVTNAGISRDIVDVGWPAAAAVAFATDVGLWVIPVALLVNFALLLPGITKTLNVDIWNFWHYAFLGSLVTAVSGSLPMGLAAAAVGAAFMLFLGDWTAKGIQEFYDLPGISIPHGFTAPMVPLALPFNWLFDKIPGLNKVDADPDGIEKALGSTFGDPMVMGLEGIGIKVNRTGIEVDKRLRTNHKHIYAAGDVTGGYQFTHAAGYEGSIVISNAIFHLPRKTDYTFLPWCTYTDPELASIGMNEKAAKAAGINYSVWTEAFKDNDRSLAEGERIGKIKMILNEKEKPLGVQILGPNAGELISEWVAVLNGKVKLSTLASAVHPYPTLGEINKRVAGTFFSPKIFSEKIKKGLKFFFHLKGRACELQE